MRLNRFLAAALGAGLTLAAGSASAASVIVDISALGSTGTTVALSAGTYTVNFIDEAQGGVYGGYSPWSSTSGCDINGMNCTTGFAESLAIDFGFGTGTFSRQDGFQHGMLPLPGDNRVYASGAQALASIQAGPIYRAALPDATNQAAYTLTTNPITFTLASAQSVNFFIFDSNYGDNRGGVSVRLDSSDPGAVPEPTTWAVMLVGFGATGAMLRRRRSATRALAV